ncbi:hypothetical protein ABZ907_23250 [Nonomuraea wenchangensis]
MRAPPRRQAGRREVGPAQPPQHLAVGRDEWQVTGRVLDYWAIVDSGWTDARPVLPR